MNYVNDKFQQSFEIVAEKFLSKIRFGELIVTFPSGVTKSFKGTNGDEIADLKLHNYKFISKKKKPLIRGFYQFGRRLHHSAHAAHVHSRRHSTRHSASTLFRNVSDHGFSGDH